MRCQRFQEMMVESLYDELDPALGQELDDHVADCEECAAEFAAMRDTLATMNQREHRDPGKAFWDGYWDRLNERMNDEPVAVTPSSRSWWNRSAVSPQRWAYRVAAAAAILTVGVFAGRTFFAPELPVGLNSESTVAERPVDDAAVTEEQSPVISEQVADNSAGSQQESSPPAAATTEPGEDTQQRTPPPAANDGGGMKVMPASSDRAMRYIEKSQMLLVALVNTDPDAADSYNSDSNMQRRSRQLVNEAADIKDELSDPKQRRLRELVGELQKILLQIANLESDEDMDAVEFIRSRVNEHDMLLKINLEQMRQGAGVDGSTSGTAPGPNSQRSIY